MIENPYLDEFRRVHSDAYDSPLAARLRAIWDEGPLLPLAIDDESVRAVFERQRRRDRAGMVGMSERDRLLREYGFAVPDRAAIEVIARLAPIVEIGAGNGYWAWVLRQAGVDVVAYDVAPVGGRRKNKWTFTRAWTEVVARDGVRAVKDHPDRALLMVWPPMEPMARPVLDAYAGSTVIHVGEGWGGATGTDDFFEELEARWEQVEAVDIPQWFGVHDYLAVYRRKAPCAPGS